MITLLECNKDPLCALVFVDVILLCVYTILDDLGLTNYSSNLQFG